MAAALPTDDAVTKAVQDFGIGTYDSALDGEHGEDDEESAKRALPDGGGPLDPFGPDRLLSYPEDADSQGKHASLLACCVLSKLSARAGLVDSDVQRVLGAVDSAFSRHLEEGRAATGVLPGDADQPPCSPRPADDTKDDVLPTASSELPSDADNPAARSDYYDRMQTGQVDQSDLPDIWADEDTGAYASEDVGETSLPGAPHNDFSMDDFLGALGNEWSGAVVEDLSGPAGFPTENFLEEADYMKRKLNDWTDDARIIATGECMNQTRRQATNVDLVVRLTSEFLKKNGKKDLTRRHVMAFLQDEGQPQYLVSDVIRCLKHSHKVYMADVLDQFPVSREASSSFRTAAVGLRERFIQLEIENVRSPGVASCFRRSAADLAHVIADLERSEDRNG